MIVVDEETRITWDELFNHPAIKLDKNLEIDQSDVED